MSINPREKEDILARAQLRNYRMHKHVAYADSALSTIILGDHDITADARKFQDSVIGILKPHLLIHYMHGITGDRSAHFMRVRDLWSFWNERYGTEIVGIDEQVMEESAAPPWCDNKESRARLREQIPSRGVLVAQSIERQYAANQSQIVAIVAARDVLRGSLACKILRDEDGGGRSGDGITHIVIEVHEREPR